MTTCEKCKEWEAEYADLKKTAEMAAEEHADEDAPILDTCIVLEPEAWKRLLEMLERPPRPSPALIELFRKYGRNV